MQSKLIILKQSFPVCDFSTAKVERLFNIRKFIQRIARFYKQNPDEPEIPEYPGNYGQSGTHRELRTIWNTPGTPDNLEHPELHMLRGFFSSKIWWFGKILVISRRFTAKLK